MRGILRRHLAPWHKQLVRLQAIRVLTRLAHKEKTIKAVARWINRFEEQSKLEVYTLLIHLHTRRYSSAARNPPTSSTPYHPSYPLLHLLSFGTPLLSLSNPNLTHISPPSDLVLADSFNHLPLPPLTLFNPPSSPGIPVMQVTLLSTKHAALTSHLTTALGRLSLSVVGEAVRRYQAVGTVRNQNLEFLIAQHTGPILFPGPL